MEEMSLYQFENVNGDPLILEIIADDKISQFNIKRSRNNCKKHISRICIVLIAILTGYLFEYCSLFYLLLSYILGIILMLKAISSVNEENLLLVESLGCQITCKHYIGKSTRYIPWEIFNDIFINEVITKHKILYILTLSTNNKLVPLFTHMLPRLDCLQLIYKHIHVSENKHRHQ